MATPSLFSLGQIYNATKSQLTSRPQDHNNWCGEFAGGLFPANLKNEQWNLFIHLGSVPPPAARSSGAIVYHGQTANGAKIDWIVSWDNPLQAPHKAYTEIRGAAPDPIDWDGIRGKLLNSGSECTSTYDGLFASVSIADGKSPVLQAVISPSI